jgi:NADH-quinone oxidoreductase subunit A
MNHWLLLPPVAFVVILVVSWLFFRICARFSFKPQKHSAAEGTSYACGEANYDNTAQPDYSTFFPFAFFFTLAHVATLIMTTVPVENPSIFVMVALYILGAAIGLYILFRK